MKTRKSILLVAGILLIIISAEAQGIFDAVRKGDLAQVKEIVEKDPQLVKARKPVSQPCSMWQ